MHRMPPRISLFLGLLLVGASTAAGGPEDARKAGELARARLELARRIYRDIEDQLKNPPPPRAAIATPVDISSTLEQLALWSRRWMEAERDLDEAKAARIASLEAHIKRLKFWEDFYGELVRGEAAIANRRSLDQLSFHRLDAEYGLAREKVEK